MQTLIPTYRSVGANQLGLHGNYYFVSPGQYGGFATMQALADWLCSDDRNGSMGARSISNPRAIVRLPGVYTDDVNLTKGHVHILTLMPGTVWHTGTITNKEWTKCIIDRGPGNSLVSASAAGFTPITRRPRTYALLDVMDDTALWSCTNGDIAKDTTIGNYIVSTAATRGSIKMTKTSTVSTTCSITRTGLSLDMTVTIIELRLKWDDRSTAGTYPITITLTDASAKTRVLKGIQNKAIEENCFISVFFSPTNYTTQTSGFDIASVTGITITANTSANADVPNIWYDLCGVIQGPFLTTPKYAITFDDNYQQGFQMASYALAKGLPVTFYTIAYLVGDYSGGRCTLDQIRQLRDAGALIGNHGFEHLYPEDNGSVEEARFEFEKAAAWLVEHGLAEGARIASYPGSLVQWNCDTICVSRDIVGSVINQGRDTGFNWSYCASEALFDPRTPRAEYPNTSTAANAYVNSIITMGGVGVCYWHQYADMTNQTNWEAHIDYVAGKVAAGQLECVTAADLLTLKVE